VEEKRENFYILDEPATGKEEVLKNPGRSGRDYFSLSRKKAAIKGAKLGGKLGIRGGIENRDHVDRRMGLFLSPVLDHWNLGRYPTSGDTGAQTFREAYLGLMSIACKKIYSLKSKPFLSEGAWRDEYRIGIGRTWGRERKLFAAVLLDLAPSYVILRQGGGTRMISSNNKNVGGKE